MAYVTKLSTAVKQVLNKHNISSWDDMKLWCGDDFRDRMYDEIEINYPQFTGIKNFKSRVRSAYEQATNQYKWGPNPEDNSDKKGRPGRPSKAHLAQRAINKRRRIQQAQQNKLRFEGLMDKLNNQQKLGLMLRVGYDKLHQD